MKKQTLSEEFKRMQKLAGLINESQLKEDISNDVKQYLNNAFEVYLEGGDTFEEEPGETHVFTIKGDDEEYKDDWKFNRALNQLHNSPIILDYNKDYVGDYGKVTVKSDWHNIYISFIVPDFE
jgi:hypothetical protein